MSLEGDSTTEMGMGETVDMMGMRPPYLLSLAYGAGGLLGGRESRKDGINLGVGVNRAIQMLLGEGMFASGSVISAINNPELRDHMDDKSVFLEKMAPLFQYARDYSGEGGLFYRYHSGEIDCSELSSEAYFTLKMMLGMRGANIDIVGREQLGDYDKSISMLYDLIRFNSGYPVDGMMRVVSKIELYPGSGLDVIHMESIDQGRNGGMNILMLPADHKDEWSWMSSRRSAEQGKVVMGPDGLQVKMGDVSALSEPLRLTGKPGSEGELGHWVARAIRSVVMGGGGEEMLDHRSFNNVRADIKDMSYGMSDVLGIVGNMVVAMGEVGEGEVLRMAEKMGVRVRGVGDDGEVEEGLVKGIRELWDGEVSEEAEETMRGLARQVARVLPVEWSEVMSEVTAPVKREVVHSKTGGQTGIHEGRSAREAVEVMSLLALEAESKGRVAAATLMRRDRDVMAGFVELWEGES